MDGFWTQPAFPFRVFDVSNNTTLLELSHVRFKRGVLFSPDSKSIMVCRNPPHSTGRISIWDIASASMTQSFSRDLDFSCAAWSPDSAYLAIGLSCLNATIPWASLPNPASMIQICNAASGEVVNRLTYLNHAVHSAVWSPTQISIFLQHHRGITAVSFDLGVKEYSHHPFMSVLVA